MSISDVRLTLWRFLWAWQQAHHYAPSYREIAAGLGLSLGRVQHYMMELETAGMITLTRFSHRTIAVLLEPPADDEEAAMQLSRGYALTMLKNITPSKQRQAHKGFEEWLERTRPALKVDCMSASEPCVFTLDGRIWAAGLIMAQTPDGPWVWLVSDADGSAYGLGVPCLKVPVNLLRNAKVEIVGGHGEL